MWYFSWILGVLLACCLGIMNVLHLEAQEAWDKDHDTLDPLTHLLTKSSMMRRLREKVDNSKRSGLPFSLLAVSLKDFRLQQAMQPHELDATLLKVADLIRQEVRQGLDIVARGDEDEFLVALPGASQAIAEQMARRIKYHAFTKLESPNHIAVELAVCAVEYASLALDLDETAEMDEVLALLRKVHEPIFEQVAANADANDAGAV